MGDRLQLSNSVRMLAVVEWLPEISRNFLAIASSGRETDFGLFALMDGSQG